MKPSTVAAGMWAMTTLVMAVSLGLALGEWQPYNIVPCSGCSLQGFHIYLYTAIASGLAALVWLVVTVRETMKEDGDA